jgi:hypothetical protein
MATPRGWLASLSHAPAALWPLNEGEATNAQAIACSNGRLRIGLLNEPESRDCGGTKIGGL